ncbi:MAG: cytochrome P450 [Proteobacteria bacterium]|nr:MAG: cytochrome P450 [Pseudomonadota bacterium]
MGGAFPPPQLLEDPYPFYRMLRGAQPVFRVPVGDAASPGVWILTRYRDVQQTLKDARFSVDRRHAQIVQQYADQLPMRAALGEGGGLRSMLVMDPPDHTRVRGLVSKAFTPRRVAALRPRIEATVATLLGEVGGAREFDLMESFAAPLPAIVIAELLGVPPEDHRQFKEWSSALVTAVGAGNPLAGSEQFEKALAQLLDYLRGVIAERRRAPREDLISAMIEAQEERDALTDAELLATSNLLLLAGHETTTNLIGNGMLALLRHPDELARLRADRALLRSAVEELLRFDSPVQATARVALADVAYGDATVPAGALVMTGIGAANRDPEAFADPDRLDLGRAENHHLSLGYGAHFCLGAPLARLEGEIAFGALLDRFPHLALASDTVKHRANFVLRGLESLPLRVG